MDCRRVDLWKRETGKRLEKEVSAAEEKEWARCWNNGYSAAQERPGREEEAGQESLADGLIEGRNAVTEALRAGAPIDKIYVSRGDTDRTLSKIVALAKQSGIVVARHGPPQA